MIRASIIVALLACSGCVSTEIIADKSEEGGFNATWGGVGDTNRVWMDCRAGPDSCIIYMEITQSEDIAPIVESIAGGIVMLP